MSLEQTVQFLRGEDAMDNRRNKAIDPERLRLVLDGYPHLNHLIEIAEHGIDAQWRSGPAPKRPPPENHGSCRRCLRAVTRSIREGQCSGEYMVVDADILELWPEVVCSPLGAVEKKGINPSEEVLAIHDLSFPKRNSANDAFIEESVPKVRYESVKTIAVRIERLANRGHAGLIDLAAPFGWSGSPPYYALFGRAISWLMESNSPASVSSSTDEDAFFPYEWVDGHILVEPDVDNRLHLAEATLRHAMLAVLGARAINEAKFSQWSSELIALGLLWNTTPVCLHTARPFYQRLQAQSTSTLPFGSVHLSAGARTDLLWFQQILKQGHLAELPLSMFGDTAKPDEELYMDASNTGLAVLDPGANEFIQIAFDDDKLNMISKSHNDMAFSINVREHMCIALALWSWGPKWYRQAAGNLVQIRCWSDNMAAVQWCNKLHSKNHLSQEINRSIGLAETYFNLRTQVPSRCRKVYMTFSSLFKPGHWPRHHEQNTVARGRSGVNGVNGCIFRGGCLSNRENILTSSRCSQLIAGDTVGAVQAQAILPAPYSPKSAMSPGIIGKCSATASPCSPAINLRSPECGEKKCQLAQKLQSPQTSSNPVIAAWYLVEHHKALGVDKFSLLCKTNASKDLQVRQLVTAIKSAAKAAGQDPDRYGSHSLRSGGASALFNADFDSLVVKLFGRWRSDVVERYARIDVRLTAKMAREMLAKPALQRHFGAPSKPHPGNGGALFKVPFMARPHFFHRV
ncbi:unnamed protein product [Phytophthora fragariaefolia]|uniref:Unnamed protein product n=1 Tax=Phytophthora fragariaefolia TaxID=1490495 RepID=A0A9W6Y4G4_9STRA|nr:unnamed protein product [Phytophthora fragariaefolia]